MWPLPVLPEFEPDDGVAAVVGLKVLMLCRFLGIPRSMRRNR